MEQFYDKIKPEKLGALYPQLKRTGKLPPVMDFLVTAVAKQQKVSPEATQRQTHDLLIKPVDDVLQGQAHILEILRAHAGNDQLTGVSNAYEALGHRMPTDDLLGNLQRQVSKILHPDRGGNIDAVQKLNDACKALKNDYNRKAYDAAVQKDPNFMQQVFEGLIGGKHQPRFRNVIEDPHLLITGSKYPAMDAVTKANKKPTLIFGAVLGVAAVAIGGYLLLQHLNKKNNEKKPAEPARA